MNILRKTGVTDCFLNIAAIIVLICTILLSAITLYQNTEVVLSVKGCSVFVYLTLLLVIVSVTLYFLIKVDIPKKIYIVLIIITSLIPRLCFVLFVQTPVDGDFLLIYNAAREVVAGDKSWLENSFFSAWGYQIPFVYYEAFILKLFGSELALKLLNVAFMVVTNVLIYLIAGKCTNSRAAFITAVLYSVYPAPVLLSSVLTNQHISLMFFMLGIYFYLVNPSWRRALISGIFLFLGNLMRPEAVLIIAAMLIHAFIGLAGNFKWEYIKNVLSRTLVSVIVFVFLAGVSSILFKVTGAAPYGILNNCPEWKFVLGLDTDSKGMYSEKNAYIITIEDPNMRLREAGKVISASFEKCKSIPLFFWEKTKIMWANMEITSWSLNHIEMSRPVWNEHKDFTYEKAINNIIYFDKAVYILLHILIFIAGIILLLSPVSKENRAFFLVTLIFINYTTYLFIEIQTRYRYFIMPSFFILAALVLHAGEQGCCPKRFLRQKHGWHQTAEKGRKY